MYDLPNPEKGVLDSFRTSIKDLTPALRKRIIWLADKQMRANANASECIELDSHSAWLTIKKLAKDNELEPKKLGKQLQKLHRFNDETENTPPLVIRSGHMGRAVKYQVPPWTRLTLRLMQLQESKKEFRIICAFTLCSLAAWLNGSKDHFYDRFRPYYFFDLGEMVQPAFCADEEMKITHGSRPFLKLFRLEHQDLPYPLIKLFKRLHRFDILYQRETDETLSEFIADRLLKNRTVNNEFFSYSPGEDKERIILEVFVTAQVRFPGLQGTLVLATQKIEQIQKVMSADTEYASFLFSHEVNTDLVDIAMSLYNLKYEAMDNELQNLIRNISEKVEEFRGRYRLVQDSFAGSQTLEFNSSSVVLCINKAIQTVKTRYALKVEMTFTPELPPNTSFEVEMRFAHLTAVFDTLLNNAFEACPTGKIKIDASLESDIPNIVQQINITISDEGSGFQANVVEAFEKEKMEIPSTKHNGSGRGLKQCHDWILKYNNEIHLIKDGGVNLILTGKLLTSGGIVNES